MNVVPFAFEAQVKNALTTLATTKKDPQGGGGEGGGDNWIELVLDPEHEMIRLKTTTSVALVMSGADAGKASGLNSLISQVRLCGLGVTLVNILWSCSLRLLGPPFSSPAMMILFSPFRPNRAILSSTRRRIQQAHASTSFFLALMMPLSSKK